MRQRNKRLRDGIFEYDPETGELKAGLSEALARRQERIIKEMMIEAMHAAFLAHGRSEAESEEPD